jgi:hypothetical protein
MQPWPILQQQCSNAYCMFGDISTSHRLSNQIDKDTMIHCPGMRTQEQNRQCVIEARRQSLLVLVPKNTEQR